MNCRYAPYEGDKPYIFFSYCHQNKKQVYPIIERLFMEGFRVWYDNGQLQGSDWLNVVTAHIVNSHIVIAGISAASVRSHSCKNEMNFAVSEDKTLLSLILEKTNLPLGITLQVSNSTQFNLLEYELAENFYKDFLNAPGLASCREDGVKPTEKELKDWRTRYLETAKPESTMDEPDEEFVSPINKDPITDNNSVSSDDSSKPNKAEGIKFSDSIVIQDNGNDSSQSKENEEDVEISADEDEGTIIETLDDEGTIIKNRPTSKERAPVAYIIRFMTGEVFSITDVETTMGRSAAHSKLAFPDEKNTISRHHANIFMVEGKFYLKDNKAPNGTFLNGKKLEPNAPAILADIALFSLSDELFVFISADKKHIIDKAKKLGKLCVLIADETQEFKLLSGARLPLDRSHQWQGGVLGDKHIHRVNEAECIFENGKYHLRDINSANGVFVDSVKLTHGNMVELKDETEIAIASARFTYKETVLAT